MSRNRFRTKIGLIAGLVLFSLVAVSSAQVAAIVHRYDFENDGPEDSLGTLDGILQGDPTFSGDAKSGGRSIVLDGAGDYLDFPDPFDFTGQFSIATWVWPEPGALGIQNLVANAPGGWATDGFKLYYNTWSDPSTADNTLIMETGNSGGAGNAYRSGAGAITEGTWNHVIATVDTTAGEVHLYVDGLEAAGTGGLVADMNVNLDWEIGAMKGAWYLAGMLDDFQVYSGVLTATEADWLYANPGLAIGDVPVVLTWDGSGSNDFNSAHWLDGPPDAPNNMAGAILPATSSDVLTVAEDGEAFSLTVDGGGIAIGGGKSLTVGTSANFAPGTTLSLGAAATLTIGGGGAVDALTTAGNATISAGGDLSVTTLDDGAKPGVFTKRGLGTLTLDNTSGTAVSAANTTFQIDTGTLASRGADPLGGAAAIVLNGGTLSVGTTTITHRYDFESDGGEDSVGTLDGILQGDPTFSDDAKSGAKSISLDGDGDYLDFPDPLDFTGQFSFATWVWPEPGALGIQNLVANAPGGAGTDGFKLFYNTWSDPATADNALIVETGNGTAGTAYGTAGGTITEGAWNHVVATVDTSAGEVHLYVDGSEEAGSGGLVTDMSLDLDWEIGAMKSGWNLAGLIDDFQIYSGLLTGEEAAWLYDNAGSAIESVLDLSGTSVTLTADSGIHAGSSATFGNLAMDAAVLSTSGSGEIRFTGTTVSAGVAAIGFHTEVPTRPSRLDGSADPLTITKSGSSDLILDAGGDALQSATFDVQGGRLIGLQDDSNPIAGAAIGLSGGEFVLAGVQAAGDVTFDNALTVAGESTITAGAGNVGAAGPLTATLGSSTNGVTLNGGTLQLRSTDDYTLDVGGNITGDGAIHVAEGSVLLSGATNSVDNLTISGGKVDTAGNDLAITTSMRLGSATFRVEGGNPLKVSGSDLLSPVAPRTLTLGGGTLSVVNSPIMHRYDFESEDGADWLGSLDGQIQGNPTFSDEAMSGDRSIALDPGDGTVDYLDFPDPMDFGRQFTIATWIKPDTSSPDQIQTILSNAVGGYGTDGFKLFYNHWNTRDGLIIVESGNGTTPNNFATNDPVNEDEWNHIVATFDLDAGEVVIYHDGQTAFGAGGLVTDTNTNSDWEIGRMKGGLEMTGLIDDLQLYGQVLTAEEALYLYENPGSIIEGELDLSATSVKVTANSTFQVNTSEDLVLADLTLEPGVALTLSGAPAASINDLRAGDGSSIEGVLVVRGTVYPGDGVGTLTIDGELEMEDQSEYFCELAGGANDLMTSEGDIFVGNTLTLRAIASLDALGDHQRTIISVEGEGTIAGEFTVVPAPDDHLGHGVFHRAVNQTEESTTVDVFQAAAGDTDGNRLVNNADLQAILGAGSFGNGTGFGWTEGDFDGDSDVDNSDLQLILGAGFFGQTEPYAAVGAAVSVVPEPATWLLLLSGVAAILLLRRRPRKPTP